MINKIKELIIERYIRRLGMQKLWDLFKGKKTYISVLGYGIFKWGVAAGWWPENDKIEAALLTAAGLSARNAIK